MKKALQLKVADLALGQDKSQTPSPLSLSPHSRKRKFSSKTSTPHNITEDIKQLKIDTKSESKDAEDVDNCKLKIRCSSSFETEPEETTIRKSFIPEFIPELASLDGYEAPEPAISQKLSLIPSSPRPLSSKGSVKQVTALTNSTTQQNENWFVAWCKDRFTSRNARIAPTAKESAASVPEKQPAKKSFCSFFRKTNEE